MLLDWRASGLDLDLAGVDRATLLELLAPVAIPNLEKYRIKAL
jgi:hypothetical protein